MEIYLLRTLPKIKHSASQRELKAKFKVRGIKAWSSVKAKLGELPPLCVVDGWHDGKSYLIGSRHGCYVMDKKLEDLNADSVFGDKRIANIAVYKDMAVVFPSEHAIFVVLDCVNQAIEFESDILLTQHFGTGKTWSQYSGFVEVCQNELYILSEDKRNLISIELIELYTQVKNIKDSTNKLKFNPKKLAEGVSSFCCYNNKPGKVWYHDAEGSLFHNGRQLRSSLECGYANTMASFKSSLVVGYHDGATYGSKIAMVTKGGVLMDEVVLDKNRQSQDLKDIKTVETKRFSVAIAVSIYHCYHVFGVVGRKIVNLGEGLRPGEGSLQVNHGMKIRDVKKYSIDVMLNMSDGMIYTITLQIV